MKPPTADYSISLENVGGDYILPPKKQNKKEKGKNQLNTTYAEQIPEKKVEENRESNGDDVLDFSGLKAAFESLAGKSEVKDVDQIPEVKKESNSIAKQNAEENGPGPLIVLPLYAMLPASSQLLVFEEAKEGERLVVVATNVAETSLTIPGKKYVVDTGREKTKNYNSCNGMESYEIQWISKASAAQRAGRAGRTGPGHCYRLYSSAVFSNLFPDFSSAEISKVPVDGVVLLMKSMYIPKAADFPFPTPPDTNALIEAERCLKVLEALDEKGSLTLLGKAMSRYPMSPRHSRMLLTAIQILHKSKGSSRSNLVLAYAVAVAAALSLTNPFITHIGENTVGDEKEKSFNKKMKQAVRASREKFSNPTSDLLTIAFALQCFELSRNQAEFCSENALQSKTMEEMSKLRKQLLDLVFTSTAADINQEFSWAHGTLEEVENAWSVSYEKHPLLLNEEEILGRAICAGWADRVAKRVKGGLNSNLSDGEKWVGAVKYQACMVKETVFLNWRSSVSKSAPEFLVYSELLNSKRPYIHGVTSVKPSWLVEYARPLCTFSAPLQDPKPYYDAVGDRVLSWVCPSFGQYLWELPLHGLEFKDRFSRVGVFCFGLLDGQVLPCLKGVRKHMAASPGIVLKTEACGVKRVGNLLGKMSRKGRVVDSCEKLRVVWEENPSEFYLEIRDWFQEGFYGEFEGLWSEMRREASLDYKERFSKRVSRKKRRRI